MNSRDVHCVYPVPGALVNELPERWRDRAGATLRDWNKTHGRFQGCCCGDTHERLDKVDVDLLECAGFVVQLWTHEGC